MLQEEVFLDTARVIILAAEESGMSPTTLMTELGIVNNGPDSTDADSVIRNKVHALMTP